MKQEIVLFEQFQIEPFVTSPLFWISNLTASNMLEINCNFEGVQNEGSEPSYKVKIVFSDNPSQNMFRPIYEIK